MKSMSIRISFLVLGIIVLFGISAGRVRAEDEVVAQYVITSADDFIVDVYHNGDLVPESRRHLLSERFGATAERIDMQIRRGDWVVFHVVSDPMRWDGVCYFAAAGLFRKNDFGFASEPDSRD